MPVLPIFGNGLNPGLTQVPQGSLRVDWSNPLTSSLIGAWVFGAMGTVDITASAPTLGYDTASGVYDLTREGGGLKSTVANSGVFAIATPAFKNNIIATGVSIYWRGYVIGNSSGFCDFAGILYDNAGSSPFLVATIQAATGGSTSGMAYGFNNSGTLQQPNASYTLTPGNIESLCATWFDVNNVFYVSGVQHTTNSIGFTPNTTATSSITINTTVAAQTRFSNTITLCAYFWNRYLSAAEVAWLNYAPYSFFVPAESELPILSAAAAGAVKFRRALSPLGTRAGSRQVQVF